MTACRNCDATLPLTPKFTHFRVTVPPHLKAETCCLLDRTVLLRRDYVSMPICERNFDVGRVWPARRMLIFPVPV